MDLQARLSDQGHPLTALQRAEVRSHPQRSHDLLVQLGVTDATWLQAVLDHHECDGGGGYPRGCTAVSPLATVLHHADVYLAKVSARTHRPALPVDQAARDLFTQNGSGGNPVVAAIVKEMGLYPPGSCVKLDNGDTAVVLRRGEHAATPRVVALCDAAGVPYPQPMPRDTRQARFKVRKPVARTNLRVRIDGPALYAL
jgi:HD-GYP domain-containing protein (c-di-GMP phosphodiesterase class II)